MKLSPPSPSLSSLHRILTRFVAWLDGFGETSFDHQSYFAGPIGGRAKALYYQYPTLGTLAVAPMIASEALFPAGRQLFWKKQRFPIADAHYAMAFTLLAEATGDEAHLRRAIHFLNVLEITRAPGAQHHGWGYPFDWVTRNGVMTAQTPLITSTPYVYEAFGAVHRVDPDEHWLAIMRSAAEHAFAEIPDYRVSEDAATAAYTPYDLQGLVVNASAYRAFMLFDAAARFGRADFARAATGNLNYVIRAQRADGAWTYATDGVRDFVDHFHTCFVLKALAKIEEQTRHPGCTKAIERGVAFYVEHLFDKHKLPRPFAVAPRMTVYRHELYDYAECINLATLLRGRYPALDERLMVTIDDLVSRWIKADGSFRSRELVLGWDNVPMHRWAQSQMFRSLCQLYRVSQREQHTAVGGVPARTHAGSESGSLVS